MANATPLNTDYDVDWVEPGELPEGVVHDHGYVHLANGYTVSILRSNALAENHTTIGFSDEKWELAVGREVTNEFLKMLGMAYEPAPELEHLINNDVNEYPVAGPFDSAGVSGFIALIGEQAAYAAEVQNEEESA